MPSSVFYLLFYLTGLPFFSLGRKGLQSSTPFFILIETNGVLLLPFYRNSFRCCLLLGCCLQWQHHAFAQTITTVAGNGTISSAWNSSLATETSIPYPTGICLDGEGNIYITTAETVKKLAAGTGIISVFAGSGASGYRGDGGPATGAAMMSPVAVCSDNKGNVFIAEYRGHRVRKVSPSGIITTIAGTGTPGFSGDGGPAAKASLQSPRSVATDEEGNLYIADFHNNRIRKVAAATGIMTTVAGTGSSASTGDEGMALMAGIAAPTSLVVLKNGDLLFSEADINISCRVRKIIAANGIITTVAGSGSTGHHGDNGEGIKAGLCVATGITADERGNLYISEYNDSRIRKLDAVTGIIHTISGTGKHGFCCDGSAAEGAMLNNPMGLAIDKGGNLLVTDNNNHRIRKIQTKVSCEPPSVTITTPSALYCYNASPQFTARVSGTVINPVYQWKINGVGYGGNDEAAVIPSVIGDVITCEVKGTNACGNAVLVSSNGITIQSNPGFNVGPEVEITGSRQIICDGATVSFTATNKSGSASPAYQWLVNGAGAGTNSPVFSTNTLPDGARVECIMTVPHCGPNGGSTKDYSNAIIIKVEPLPEVSFTPSEIIIEPGQQVLLKPLTKGDIVSHLWQPSGLLENPLLLQALTTPLRKTITYHLTVKTAGGCEASDSVNVIVYSKLYMPNSFTPNSDGKNDVFRVPATAAFSLKEFAVFDRWGQAVFISRDIAKGWDGKKNGTALPTGTYVYLISGKDNKGTVLLKGTVQLLR